MDRIRMPYQAALNNRVPNLSRTLIEILRIRSDAARLDTLPRDLLADMGIAPRTKDNERHSGQRGRLPSAQSW